MNWKRKLLIIGGVAGLATVTASCGIVHSEAKASPGMYVLVQDTGAGGSGKISKVVYPGSSTSKAADDTHWKIPASVRNYICSANPSTDCGGHPMSGFTKSPDKINPGAPVVVEWRAEWRLNPTEEKLKGFFNDVCQKYTCAIKNGTDESKVTSVNNFSSPGWNGMLGENFYPASQRALLNQLVKYTNSELLRGGQVWNDLGAGMTTDFMALINRATNNGNYFCGADTIRGGECKPIQFTVLSVGVATQAQADAITRLNTADTVRQANEAEQNNLDEQQRREIDRQNKLADAASTNYAKPGYIQERQVERDIEVAKQCAASQKCVMLVGGDGKTTVVTP